MTSRTAYISCLAMLAATAASHAFKWDLPDPRYRAPLEIWEIETVAFMVASASGLPIGGRLDVTKDNEAPLIRMRGPLTDNVMVLNPVAVRVVPPNSWAFILGNQFARRTTPPPATAKAMSDQELSRRNDIVGATFARAAGFDLGAHLAWALGPCTDCTCVDEANTERVMALARHFRISRWTINRHRQRLGWAPWFKR